MTQIRCITTKRIDLKLWGHPYPTLTYNDSVDIAAPGRQVVSQTIGQPSGVYGGDGGTSLAAPFVAGTIGLMFDKNYCLTQKEVETILKLSSRKIDHLPANQAFYGKIGSGVLDAYEAVKKARDMAEPFGTVEVKDRILYRWFYKLETAPYEIKMTNNDVMGNARIKFKARNNIEILSGDGGYVDLSIDETLVLNCSQPFSKSVSTKINKQESKSNLIPSVSPNPTTGIFDVINGDGLRDIYISDITGKIIYNAKDLNVEKFQINISRFNSGLYFVKIETMKGEISSEKVIKK